MNFIEKTLIGLGYRRLNDRMVKPIGFSCLIYFLNTNRIGSYFFGSGTVKSLICWTSEDLSNCEAGDFAGKVIGFEEWQHKSGNGRFTNFSFFTAEEQCSFMLDA